MRLTNAAMTKVARLINAIVLMVHLNLSGIQMNQIYRVLDTVHTLREEPNCER
jgi:hypothetical protein